MSSSSSKSVSNTSCRPTATITTLECCINEGDAAIKDASSTNNSNRKKKKKRQKIKKKNKEATVTTDDTSTNNDNNNKGNNGNGINPDYGRSSAPATIIRPRRPPSATIGRPISKKRLRKLRYQRRQLSPAQFLIASAQSLVASTSGGGGGIIQQQQQHDNNIVHVITAAADNITANTTTTTTSTNSSIGEDHSRRDEEELSSPTSSLPDISIISKTHQHLATATTITTTTIQIKPLLVLDMNGILCHRIRRIPSKEDNAQHTITSSFPFRSAIANIAGTPVIPRTDATRFVEFLDEHFVLAVWTSAKSKTAAQLIRALFPVGIQKKLLFVWSQHHCDVIKQQDNNKNGNNNNNAEPQSLLYEKDLSKVWDDYPLWNSNNTLLIDDSPEKCVVKWSDNAVHPPPLNGRQILIPSSSTTTSTTTMESEEEQLLEEDQHGQQQLDGDDDGTITAPNNSAITTPTTTLSSLLLPDEVNEQRQYEFFRKLVEYWKQHPLKQIFWGDDASLDDASNDGDDEANTNTTTTTTITTTTGSGDNNNNNAATKSSFTTTKSQVNFLKDHATGHMGWKI